MPARNTAASFKGQEGVATLLLQRRTTVRLIDGGDVGNVMSPASRVASLNGRRGVLAGCNLVEPRRAASALLAVRCNLDEPETLLLEGSTCAVVEPEVCCSERVLLFGA